jgi:8-oxo-dGTP pyrophosphatase MutT (NUDIX family)
MDKIEPELSQYLASGRKIAEGSATWDEGRIPLTITYYLSNVLPPLRYVSSVRGMLLRDETVMVVCDRKEHFYITPGGRREGAEVLEETLHREILEETGWTFGETMLLGFIHLHHLAPESPDYAFPYPDFLWIVYLAEADRYFPKKLAPGQYELETSFRSIEEARALLDEPGQLQFLDAAIKLRRKNRR